MLKEIEIDLIVDREDIEIDVEIDQALPVNWACEMMKKEDGGLKALTPELLRGVVEIPPYFCFSNSTIERVYLPDVKYVGGSAFNADAKLKTIVLPKASFKQRTVPDIDSSGKPTTNVNMEYTNASSAPITNLPSLIYLSMQSIDSYSCQSAFECTSLRYVDMPNLTKIGRYSFDKTDIRSAVFPKLSGDVEACFRFCKNLRYAIFPEVTAINEDMFSSCSSLEVVYLPKVERGSSRMKLCAMCPSLRDVVIGDDNSKLVPQMYMSSYESSKPFSKADLTVLSIWVPDHMLDAYRTATNWSVYADNIKPQSEMPESLWEEINNAEMERAPQWLIEEATA